MPSLWIWFGHAFGARLLDPPVSRASDPRDRSPRASGRHGLIGIVDAPFRSPVSLQRLRASWNKE
jgi:hypothetical protein